LGLKRALSSGSFNDISVVDGNYPVSIKLRQHHAIENHPILAVVSSANMAIVRTFEMGRMVLKTRLMMK
jgi:hypothetical protein